MIRKVSVVVTMVVIIIYCLSTNSCSCTQHNQESLPQMTAQNVEIPTVSIEVGAIIRTPVQNSPEWLVQQVLAAALDPDEEKGWRLFESLLHTQEKIGSALVTRRSMNFAASRRKVKLFLVEDETKPLYRIVRVAQEGKDAWKIFVFNKSENAMPTPCTVRYDTSIMKWRVAACSL